MAKKDFFEMNNDLLVDLGKIDSLLTLILDYGFESATLTDEEVDNIKVRCPEIGQMLCICKDYLKMWLAKIENGEFYNVV